MAKVTKVAKGVEKSVAAGDNGIFLTIAEFSKRPISPCPYAKDV